MSNNELANIIPALVAEAKADWLEAARDTCNQAISHPAYPTHYFHSPIFFASSSEGGKILTLGINGGTSLTIFTSTPGLGQALADAINEVLRTYQPPMAQASSLGEAIDDEIPF